MLAVLIVIMTTDLIFAVDSIPAIFAVTDMAFIVMAANAFALLGLRAMYFMLDGAMQLFDYLTFGLAAVLIFIGTKMMLTDIYKIPIAVSLGVVITIIATSIIASLIVNRNRGNRVGSGEDIEVLTP